MRSTLLFYLLFSNAPFIINESNSFLNWAEDIAKINGSSSCWICGLLPVSSTSGIPWWMSPLQEQDWLQLQILINDDRTAQSTLSAGITNWNVKFWPINNTLREKGHKFPFSYNVTKNLATIIALPQLQKASNRSILHVNNHRYENVFFQIWDEYIWVTPMAGCLNQNTPLCWEQRNHSNDYCPSLT